MTKKTADTHSQHDLELNHISDRSDRRLFTTRYLERLLHCRQETIPPDILASLRANGLLLGEGLFAMCIFSVESNNSRTCKLKKIDDIHGKLIDLLERELSAYAICHVEEIDSFIVGIINNPSIRPDADPEIMQTSQSMFRDSCDFVISGFKETYGVKLSAYVSGFFFGLDNFPRVFGGLAAACDYYRCFLLDCFKDQNIALDSETVEVNSFADESPPDYTFLRQTAQLACFHLKNNSFEDAKEGLRRAYNRILSDVPHTLAHMHIRLCLFMGTLFNLLPGSAASSADDVIASLLGAKEFYTMRMEYWNFLGPIFSEDSEPDERSTVEIEEVKLHIGNNIGNPGLSSQNVAKRFEMSPSLLSMKFKKATGETLISYIHRQRIERAIKLIRTTDRTLPEICKLSGYGSIATFYRSFKKHTGVGPSYFRNEASEQE